MKSLEEKLAKDEMILELIQDLGFAEELYAALSNIQWFRMSDSTRDPDAAYTFSFRYAAGMVASMRNQGENYMDFYCSSKEGIVSRRIQDELKRLGWKWTPYTTRRKS